MVVLSCALLTKAGKVLLSRQFVEMTRIRIEGLLAAFPKLMGSDSRQHTFVETESVRYVYLPIDGIYLLLVTNRASNIVEDLETLKLLSKVVPSIACPIGSISTTLTEEKVLDNCFDLIFAFDEVITAGGYREPINLQQIKTNMEMESHEEKLHMMIKLRKMETAKESARDAAKAIREKQREAARLGGSSLTGFGSDGGDDLGGGGLSMSQQLGLNTGDTMYTGGSGASSGMGRTDSGLGTPSSSASLSAATTAAAPQRASLPPKKGMSLGSMGAKNKNLEDALLKEDKLAPVALSSSASRHKAAAAEEMAAPVAPQVQHPIMLAISEKVSARMSRDGVLELFDIKGTLNLTAATDEAAMCSVQLNVSNSSMFAFVTHPKVNKQLYEKTSLLQLKDASKGFPSQRPVGILRWTHSNTGSEELVPLKINCWPEEEAGGIMNVSIEYEMELKDMELHDVRIHIPLGTSDAPNIVNVDGAHRHNSSNQELVWNIELIDASNRTGALEFNIKQKNPDAFFPINCTFASQQLYCQLDVVTVKSTEANAPIMYGLTKGMSEDEYTIG